MIHRVYRGHHTGGLLAYLYGPGRANEHVDPHLVTCWDRYTEALEAPDFDASRLTEGEVRQHALSMARVLDLPLAICEDHDPNHVYHLVLRNDPSDPTLTDQQWAEIARDMMDRTGIAPAGDDLACQWVLVRHAADHVHLVATLARQDGGRPQLFRDYLAQRQVAREWEERLGLKATSPARKTASAGPTIGETKRAERTAGTSPGGDPGRADRGHAAGRGGRGRSPETPRQHLARAVHAAAARTNDLDSFTAALAEAGVEVHLRMSESNPGQVTGVSFSISGHTDRDGNPIKYGGSKLAPDLSWSKLSARWGVTASAGGSRFGDGLRDGPTDGADTAEAATPGRQVWEEAERIVQEAAQRIRAAAADHPAGASDEAWAASDALRGLAWGLEGDAGGPLSDAADSLANAGRELYARLPVSSDSGRALRAVGRLVAVWAARTHNPELQLRALLLAMAALARAVVDLRNAQDRLAQAGAARDCAERLAEAPPLASRRATTRPGDGGQRAGKYPWLVAERPQQRTGRKPGPPSSRPDPNRRRGR